MNPLQAQAMQRRYFLRTLAGVAGGLAAAGELRPAARAGGVDSVNQLDPTARAGPVRAEHRALDAIGVQLYTVRELMERDLEETLAQVAQIGYNEVEFAGYFDRSPDQVREALEQTGLAAPAAHVSMELLGDEWQRTLDEANEIGHRYLIVPWIAEDERQTLDGYRRVAERFNRAGEQAREVDIRFGYHNHDFEFVRIDGQIPYDILVAETEPATVAHEMDLYWAVKGGVDPLDYFERFPGRFELVHVKDMDGTPEQGMTDVGQGVIDFPNIFARASQAGIRHCFVEHDDPSDPLETIRVGYRYLRRLNV